MGKSNKKPAKRRPKASKILSKANLLPGLVRDWGGFEQFVADLNKTAEDVVVEHNARLVDRHGVTRNIDVVLRYRVGLAKHLVVCECKFWKTNVPREKVDAFVTTVAELNASRGIMFSALGFQSGAIDAARANGISLFKVREPNTDEWGAPGRFIDIYLAVVGRSIGPMTFPGAAAIPPITDPNIRFDMRIGGEDATRTEAIVSGGERIIMEEFLLQRSYEAARQILQAEVAKGLPFFPDNGRRLVWRTTTVLFHPQAMRPATMPNVLIPAIIFPVGIDIMQTRIKTDRAANYTFAVAVEDCITNGVTAATRRMGDALTSQFPLLPKEIDPTDVLQNGSTITVWMRDLQPFTPFEHLAEGVTEDGDIPAPP